MDTEYERPQIIYEGELEVHAGTPGPKLPGLPDLEEGCDDTGCG